MLRSRYRRILRFFAGVLLHLLWWDILLPRLGLGRLAGRTRSARLQRIARRFRALAVQMGGVMIKVGQWLSARLDVLPPQITDELSGLQDEVRPENLADIRRVIEEEFNEPLENLFCDFEAEPLAAASIGQVHRARLCPDQNEQAGADLPRVVVKVQRPNIAAIVETDLSALRVVARWIQLYRPIQRRVNVPSLVVEFSQSLYEEIDYLNEGKNAGIFAENFASREDVVVPQVYWNRTTRRVLTLQDVQAIKITDYDAIEAAGIHRGQVAARLFDVYLKQIFDDQFFHADPHPGNLFVLPLDGEEMDENGSRRWKLVFVDFGMAGTVTPNVFAGLRDLIISVAQRDASRVISAYQKMGVLLPGADLELLRQANERAFERFWGKTTPELLELSQSEAVAFIMEFRDLLFDAPFQLPQNMILLGRALSILNGICTGLDESFNVWLSVVPYAEKLASEEGGGTFKTVLREGGEILLALANLPRRAESLIRRMEQGRLDVRTPELRRQIGALDRSVRRLTGAVFFAVFFFGGIQLYLAGEIWMAVAAAGLGLVALLAVLFAPA